MPQAASVYRQRVVDKLSDPTIGEAATVTYTPKTTDQDTLETSADGTPQVINGYIAETQVMRRLGTPVSGVIQGADYVVFAATSYDFEIRPSMVLANGGVNRGIREVNPIRLQGETIAYELRLER